MMAMMLDFKPSVLFESCFVWTGGALRYDNLHQLASMAKAFVPSSAANDLRSRFFAGLGLFSPAALRLLGTQTAGLRKNLEKEAFSSVPILSMPRSVLY
jgi:hypothetical protein